MPSPTRRCGSSAVMSRPSSQIVPAVGRSTPVRRLMIVVLPAPFGPISAWRAPFCTDRETSLVATIPPKCFSSPRVSSTGGIGTPLAREPASHLALQRVGAFGDLRTKRKDMRPRDHEHGDDRYGAQD